MKVKKEKYPDLKDGSIVIAPIYTDKLRNNTIKEMAVHNLIKAVMKECQTLLIPIKEEATTVWDDILKDYNLDPNIGYKIYGGNILKKIENKEAT